MSDNSRNKACAHTVILYHIPIPIGAVIFTGDCPHDDAREDGEPLAELAMISCLLLRDFKV